MKPLHALKVNFEEIIEWTKRNFDFKITDSLPYFHAYYWKRNTTWLWDQGDNRDTWLKHLKNKKMKEILERSGWLSNYKLIEETDNKYPVGPYGSKSEIQIEQSENISDEAITYKWNNEGFRGDDLIETDEGVLSLGCSITNGQGVPYKKIWPTLVSKELGLNNWNLGIPGASNDACYAFASYWIPILKPKYVCMLGPNIYRRYFVDIDFKIEQYRKEEETVTKRADALWDLVNGICKKPDSDKQRWQGEIRRLKSEIKSITDTKNYDFDPNCTRTWPHVNHGSIADTEYGWDDAGLHGYLKYTLLFELDNVYQSKSNALKNIDAIKYLCIKHNVEKFVYIYSDDSKIPYIKTNRSYKDLKKKELNDIDYEDLGRELDHPGVKSHKWMADYFLEKINE